MYIYKITNKINNKFYIGKSSFDVNESLDYYGSGKLIKLAIKKYGIENFIKEILVNDIQDDTSLNKLEIQFIKKHKNEFGKQCYNLALGGEGGNSLEYYSKEQYDDFIETMKQVSIRSDQCGDKNPNWGNKYDTGTLLKGYMFFKHKNNYNNIKYLSLDDILVQNGEFIPFSKNVVASEESKEKMSKAHIEYYKNNDHYFKNMKTEDHPNFGSKRTEDQKENMKKAQKLNHSIKITCEFCGKKCNKANHARWHGNNCKYKN